MVHNCISQNNKSSWKHQELTLLQVAGSTLSSKQKGQLLKFGCHFSRQMPAVVPKIANPPPACWFLPLFHPSYPCKTMCINVWWTRRGKLFKQKILWQTQILVLFPACFTSSSSSQHMHRQKERKENPRAEWEWSCLLQGQCQLQCLLPAATASWAQLAVIHSFCWVLRGNAPL